MSANLVTVRLGSAWRSKQEDVADRLHGRQADREVAAVLGDDFWPCSPSFWSSSSLGMTTVSSCMMIEAVM